MQVSINKYLGGFIVEIDGVDDGCSKVSNDPSKVQLLTIISLSKHVNKHIEGQLGFLVSPTNYAAGEKILRSCFTMRSQ